MKKTQYLPDLDFVATNTDELLDPNLCREGMVVRKGKIKKKDGTVVEAVAACHAPKGNFNAAFLTFENGKWSLSMGFTNDSLKDAFFPVIQTRDW